MQIGSINFKGSLPDYGVKAPENKTTEGIKEEQNFEFSSNASNAVKNNAAAFINFKGKPPETIDSICARLKEEYGINAEFENLYTAKTVLSAVEDFVKLNNKDMFQGLEIEIYDKENGKSFWSTHSDYDDKSFVLKFNNMEEDELKEKTQKAYDDCYYASDDLKYSFYEGLGEFLNFKYNPYAYTRNFNLNNFSTSCLKKAMKLGGYAANSFERYASTYIAARMCKVPTTDEMDKIYMDFVGADLNFPKANPIKEFKGREHDFKTLDEAYEYLKNEYEIDAEFDNLTVANLTAGAIDDFVELNNDKEMFKGLQIVKRVANNSDIIGSMHYEYDHYTGEKNSNISFNSAYDWKRHEYNLYKNYNAAHHSSTNPKNPIYHELAHWLDFNSDPREYAICDGKFKSGEIYVNDYGKRVFGRVSGYAQTSKNEFRAEYIAARMCGLSFPKAVQENFEEGYYSGNKLNLNFPTV